MSDAQRLLKKVFGFDAFRGAQEEIVEQLVGGDDALVLMPTGGGKSLCYQIPSILREGTGLVVSPLIALMQDQVAALRQHGVRVACLNSNLEPAEQRQVERQLMQGELDLLYLAPERLMLERTLEMLKRVPLALIAIDEAHCVSQWGHDFRPEYLRLAALAECFPGVPRIALTATADPPTQREIVERLTLGRARKFIAGFDRPNIRYQIVDKAGGREQLKRFLDAEHPDDAGIVYCMSRKKVDQTAAWLRQLGRDALPYHAGLDKRTRSENQSRFLREDGVVIVATIAFGMGIDKPDVRFVAHLDLPKSLEAYYQETGRAGRDGLPANAWMAYGLQDVILQRKMLESSQADDAHKRMERQRLESLLGFCEITSCRRRTLIGYFGESYDHDCGNCDTCLQPVQSWDGSEAAQKGLSCVYRTGQRFGVQYLIDILLGKESERNRNFGHTKLPTFGVGADLDGGQWRSVFRQLVARGLLTVDIEGYGSLKLTARAAPVLKGEEQIEFRVDPERPAKSRKRRSSTRDDSRRDSPIFEALRLLRKTLAEEAGVPPYVVFHDATLLEMAERLPATRAEFSELSGVGASKLERYAHLFLDELDRLRPSANT